jgi:ADP-ribose pyrophosphatase YjhB (NUDIX family)
MKKLPTVCCVIVLDSNNNNEILLTKRGRNPSKGKWGLISGIGYLDEGMTVEEGVAFEVLGDVKAKPVNITKQFTVIELSQEIVVFTAEVKRDDIIFQTPHVMGIKWCLADKNIETQDLAFNHSNILDKYLL